MKTAALALAFLLAFSAFFAQANSIAVSEVEAVGAETVKASAMVSHFEVALVYVNVSGSHIGEVVVSITRIPNQTIPTDGVTDVYKLKLNSNGHVIGSNVMGCTIGANPSMDYLWSLAMSMGHIGSESLESNGSQLSTWDIYYDPVNPSFVGPLTVSLSRMGWIVVDGNDTYNNLSLNQEIQQVQLVRSQNDFIYGNLPPEVSPVPTTPELSPSPSLTQKPVVSIELTPALATALVVVSVALVAVACGAILLYFRKRRFQPESPSPAYSAAPLGSQAPH